MAGVCVGCDPSLPGLSARGPGSSAYADGVRGVCWLPWGGNSVDAGLVLVRSEVSKAEDIRRRREEFRLVFFFFFFPPVSWMKLGLRLCCRGDR